MGNQFASGKHAIADCDRCDQRYRLSELKDLYVKFTNTHIMVCQECWEESHPQLMLGTWPISDPQAIREPRPDKRTDVFENKQFLGFTNEGVPFYAWIDSANLAGTSGMIVPIQHIQAVYAYFPLPVSSGPYVSTPNASANRITGDSGGLVYVEAVDYTPIVNEVIASKWDSSTNQRSWIWYFSPNGKLNYVWSTGGSTTLGPITSTVAPTVTDGQGIWLAYGFDVDVSGVAKRMTFYRSDQPRDTNPVDVVLTQLGAPITQAGTTSLFSSSAAFQIGDPSSFTLGSFVGNISRYQLFNNLTRNVVADFNPRDGFVGEQQFTSSATGEIYTFNNNAALIR